MSQIINSSFNNQGGCTIMGKQVTPTLVSGQYKQSGNTQDGLSVVTAIETHGRDSRWKISGDVFQTMSAAAGTGGGNVPMLMEDTRVYRGDAITSPINKSNPQAGDPCHTLANDDRNYLVRGGRPWYAD